MSPLKIIIGNKNYSSWSLRGWLAVKLSGLDFEETLLPLDTSDFHATIKSLSPSGTVPALWHGETLVWDSLAIIDYIDRLCPELGLWPSDPSAFAFAKSIAAEMHSGLFALRGACPMNMREEFKGYTAGQSVQKNIDRIEALWTESLTRFSGTGPFLFGEKMTAADIMFAPVVSRFRTYDIPMNERCEAYRQAVENHPAYQDWYQAALQESWIVAVDEIDRDVKILGAD